ncbi:hypothetical protein ARAM_001825 [Aspergillus rambellii]|uniref:DUF7703 domain-containing protein n=1 Tax=Aspergillus rambellii TaxID=308745 RepID=A0A0F8UCF3_9EURO|nr:hypothetical protein ARAM_001825 [Aspergillus rambellii]
MAGSQTASETTGFTVNQVEKYIVTAFVGIAWYNAIELVILCLATFKRYEGTYFWSLLITSLSIIPYCLGFILFFFVAGISPYIPVTLIVLSWYCTVTGHSVVLWSRLHLVLQKPKVLRCIIYLIVFDAIILQIPITVLLYGALTPGNTAFSHGYSIMEHIQLIGFCLQESLISGLYIWETFKLLRLRPSRPNRRILSQLLAINIVVLVFDVAVVAIEYAGKYGLQVVFKPVAYSIKLRLEYAILGRLVLIATSACSESDPMESSVQTVLNPALSRPTTSDRDPSSAEEEGEWRQDETDLSSISRMD